MNILSKVQYGSRLYGTQIESSDWDERVVFLPTIKDCVLLNVRAAWEDKSENDKSVFSLQFFLDMLSTGQGVAIELICAPQNAVLQTSELWEDLRANRKKFFSKQMNGLVGFAKSQAKKYSNRIDRLRETEAILSVLKSNSGKRLYSVWDDLPISTNATKGENDRQAGDRRVYRVCGREIQINVMVDHALEVIGAIHASYGERVRAAKNGEIEWKSYAHAFRAALQCKELAETGDLVFPLKDAEWLRNLRLGKFNFLECGLDKKLDDLILEVESSMKNSSLPDHADKDYAREIVLKAYNL